MPNPGGAQRVEDRVHRRGQRADGASLAHAFDAELVGEGGDQHRLDRHPLLLPAVQYAAGERRCSITSVNVVEFAV